MDSSCVLLSTLAQSQRTLLEINTIAVEESQKDGQCGGSGVNNEEEHLFCVVRDEHDRYGRNYNNFLRENRVATSARQLSEETADVSLLDNRHQDIISDEYVDEQQQTTRIGRPGLERLDTTGGDDTTTDDESNDSLNNLESELETNGRPQQTAVRQSNKRRMWRQVVRPLGLADHNYISFISPWNDTSHIVSTPHIYKVDWSPPPDPHIFPSSTSRSLSSGPHMCPFHGCTRMYAKSSHLAVHMRRHTGEKPFVCDWPRCVWRFARSDELARHKRSHSGVKPYRCGVCSKPFSRSDHVAKHARVHWRHVTLQK